MGKSRRLPATFSSVSMTATGPESVGMEVELRSLQASRSGGRPQPSAMTWTHAAELRLGTEIGGRLTEGLANELPVAVSERLRMARELAVASKRI